MLSVNFYITHYLLFNKYLVGKHSFHGITIVVLSIHLYCVGMDVCDVSSRYWRVWRMKVRGILNLGVKESLKSDQKHWRYIRLSFSIGNCFFFLFLSPLLDGSTTA